MWYLGSLRWPPPWIWAAAAAVVVIFAGLSALGVGHNILNVFLGIVLCMVLVVAIPKTSVDSEDKGPVGNATTGAAN
jgi:hypothetical protein